MRKYICDNCGAEFSSLGHYDEEHELSGYELFKLVWQIPNYQSGTFVVGEYCRVCKEKITARVKEGVQ